MDCAWCLVCNADVSIQHAESGLPCPACRGTDYFIMRLSETDNVGQTDDEAERFMRQGKWDEAEEAYKSCQCFEPSETALRMAVLNWRKDCASFSDKLLLHLDGEIDVAEFRKALLAHYDEYVAKWILQEYRGIVLLPNGDSYTVARREM